MGGQDSKLNSWNNWDCCQRSSNLLHGSEHGTRFESGDKPFSQLTSSQFKTTNPADVANPMSTTQQSDRAGAHGTPRQGTTPCCGSAATCGSSRDPAEIIPPKSTKLTASQQTYAKEVLGQNTPEYPLESWGAVEAAWREADVADLRDFLRAQGLSRSGDYNEVLTNVLVRTARLLTSAGPWHDAGQLPSSHNQLTEFQKKQAMVALGRCAPAAGLDTWGDVESAWRDCELSELREWLRSYGETRSGTPDEVLHKVLVKTHHLLNTGQGGARSGCL